MSGPSTNTWFQAVPPYYSLRAQISRTAEEARNSGRIKILAVGSAQPILVTPLLEFSATEWKCAQLVHEGSEISLYIDGNVVAQSQTAASLTEVAYAPLSFSGGVDDIRLYSRALSVSELADIRKSED